MFFNFSAKLVYSYFFFKIRLQTEFLTPPQITFSLLFDDQIRSYGSTNETMKPLDDGPWRR